MRPSTQSLRTSRGTRNDPQSARPWPWAPTRHRNSHVTDVHSFTFPEMRLGTRCFWRDWYWNPRFQLRSAAATWPNATSATSPLPPLPSAGNAAWRHPAGAPSHRVGAERLAHARASGHGMRPPAGAGPRDASPGRASQQRAPQTRALADATPAATSAGQQASRHWGNGRPNRHPPTVTHKWPRVAKWKWQEPGPVACRALAWEWAHLESSVCAGSPGGTANRGPGKQGGGRPRGPCVAPWGCDRSARNAPGCVSCAGSVQTPADVRSQRRKFG
jgi:hypothetical protein